MTTTKNTTTTTTTPALSRRRSSAAATRKAKALDIEVAPSLGGATEAPAAPAPARKRTRKAAPAVTEAHPLAPALAEALAINEAAAVKRKALPNSERRNECPHPDAAEAVATLSCTCGALPGVRCTNKAGKLTNHVHANRMTGLDLARRYEATPVEDKPAKARKARTVKAAK